MVEISTPMLISSSSPSVLTQHGDKADFPASSAGQVGSKSMGTRVLGKKASPCPMSLLDADYVAGTQNA